MVPVKGEGVLLLSERGAYLLRGHRGQVATLVDGERTAEKIVSELSGGLDPALAWSALMRLEADGYVTERRAGATDDEEAVFWSALDVDPATAADALAAARVRVFGARRRLAERFAAALRRFAIGAPVVDTIESFDPPASNSSLDVVLAGDYLADELLQVDDASRTAHSRWLLVRPAGTEIWLGPLFDAAASPASCLRCLRRRLQHLRPAQRLAAWKDPAGTTTEPLGSLAGTEELACLAAATEVAKLLAGAGGEAATGVVRTISLRDWSSRTHRLIGHPACPACGAPPRRELAPVKLQRRPVAFDADGGHRTVAPHETLLAYEHLASPLTGIIGSLVSDTQAPEVGRTCVAEDIAAVEQTSVARLAASFRSISMGKGMTDAQAMAGALGEAVEHYSARLQGTEVKRSGTWRELQGEAIHPNAVMNFSDHQYRTRDAWNARHRSGMHFVPRWLEDDERIDWTPLWSLTEGRPKLLPTHLLYYDPWRKLGDSAGGIGCSNGCAAGNTLEEAVLQGFLELVERDAVAIWWYNRLRRPAIDLDSFDDRWLAEVGRHHRTHGREAAVLDLTTDLGIPVAAALSHRVEGPQERIAVGYGCHLDARIAVQRALTELCQMLNLDLRGDDETMDSFGDGWMRWATRAEHPYLVPDETATRRTRADFPDPGYGDLLDSIEYCRRMVEGRGMEMLVLDQTRADTGMPVAKVVVPGLRHFWPRFGAGRLYDVPVDMGWRAAPCPESDLNQVPFFF